VTNDQDAFSSVACTNAAPNEATTQDPSRQRREYFEQLFPDVGDGKFINIHWKTTRLSREGKPIWDGVACRTIDEALTWVDRASAMSDVQDIYACTSTQRECRENGNGFRRAVRSTGGSVSQASIFLDLDAKGQGKDSYNSLAEALAALDNFLKAIGLEPTMTVSSGGGVHVYIGLDRPIGPEEWKPLAFALAGAAKQHGLKFDAQCTVDVSRILRVPSTYNYKPEYGQPVPVQMIGAVRGGYALSYIEQVLTPYKVEVTRTAGAAGNVVNFPQRKPLEGSSELSAGINPNIEEIRSAARAIPPQAIASEGDWVRVARALAHEARVYSSLAKPLYEILDEISVRAPGYNAHENRSRFERYMSEAYVRNNPITIGTLFALATKHGWSGWPTTIGMQGAAGAVTPESNPAAGPAVAPSGFGAAAQPLTAGLGVSFGNIKHRQWLYGTLLEPRPGGVLRSAWWTGQNIILGGAGR
jgi:hypothetical protein